MIYYLSIGSNLGDRRENLERAIAALNKIGHVISVSSVYETTPVEMNGAADFLNAALALESELRPADLLSRIKEVEACMGRDLKDSHLQPRSIDIDILLADELILDTPQLVIPHPRMTERAFVLIPLLEIAADLVHPLLKKPLSFFLKEIDPDQRVRRVTT